MISAAGCARLWRWSRATRTEGLSTGRRRLVGVASAAGVMLGIGLPLLPVGADANAADAYAATVAADSPAAYWRLGEATGATTAVDASGNGRTGTYTGSVTTGVAGALVGDGDTAATFDGSGGSVSVADTPALRLNGAFTVEFFAKRNTPSASYPGLMVKGPSWTADGWLIFHTSDGRVTFKRNNVELGTRAGELLADHARHFALVYDGSTLRWYVDGQANASMSVTFPTNNGTSALLLGQGDGSNYGAELLDEVAVYGSALSDARLHAHVLAGAGSYARMIDGDSPAGYWRLGEGSPAYAADWSGHGLAGGYDSLVTHMSDGALIGDPDPAAHFTKQPFPAQDAVHVDTGPAVDFNTDFSAEAWVRTSVAEEQPVLSDNGGAANWVVTVTDDAGKEGRPRFKVSDGATNWLAYGPAIRVDDGAWHHLVVVVERSYGLRVYVDGVAANTPGVITGTVSTTAHFHIGWNSTYLGFTGDIDEVAIYGRALTAGTVGAHYRVGWLDWTVSLASSATTPNTGSAVTLTAAVNADVAGSELVTSIFDQTTGSLLGSCSTGTTCQVSTQQASATAHTFVAYVSSPGSSPPPPHVQATSALVTVTWTNQWTLTLAAGDTTPNTGTATTLTATANAAATGTQLVISIFDTNTGTLLASCASGTTCQANVSQATATTRSYAAYVATAGSSQPPANVQASASLSVTWASEWTVTLAANTATPIVGLSVTLTATSNLAVANSPYVIEIFDLTTGALLTTCSTGTSCQTSTSQIVPSTHTYVAYTSALGATLPPPNVQATSNTVNVTWGAGVTPPSAWQVALAALPPITTVDNAVTLRAIANASVDGTGYVIAVFDQSTGALVDACTTGQICTVSVSESEAITKNYIAFVTTPSTSYPPPGMQAASQSVAVTWL